MTRKRWGDPNFKEYLYQQGWVALIEPLGEVVRQVDFFGQYDRVTDVLQVREIMAFCRECWSEGAEPLTQSDVVGRFGDGIFVPVCSFDNHPLADWMETFKFQIQPNGQVHFSDF